MTAEELIVAGFGECKPSPPHDRWDMLYQKRVRDAKGTRYFINCYLWRHSKYNEPGKELPDGWEVKIIYNDGCEGSDGAAVMVTAWAGVESWSAEKVLGWCANLWTRLEPKYYELNSEG